jgi:diacylglycerol kinase family enzyme
MARVSTAITKRAGLIVNPRAGRGAGKGLALAEKLKDDPLIKILILEQFGQLESELRKMATEGVTDLFISSGDGTIQAILTILAEHRPFSTPPRVGLLPHGTTNLSARDLGFRNRSLDAQADFLRKCEALDVITRHTIRCANPADGMVRHGMFVGTGAVAEATRYCQTAFNEQGMKGQLAVATTLLRGVAQHLLSEPKPGDDTRFDRPFAITVETEDQRLTDGPQLLQMSTTLSQLVLGARPFWGGGHGMIRTTVLPFPVPSVLRWILPVMYGGANRATPPGAVSFRSDEVKVTTRTMFVIDGEFFQPPENEPLQMNTGPSFSFIKG